MRERRDAQTTKQWIGNHQILVGMRKSELAPLHTEFISFLYMRHAIRAESEGELGTYRRVPSARSLLAVADVR